MATKDGPTRAKTEIDLESASAPADAKAQLAADALAYHESPPAGKIRTGITKPVGSQRDLTLAYSPGVAAPCLKIAENEDLSFRYTGRGNLVAVISNGTAVLGLGDIGPHAAKPVMEGKAMLFKKFADIDVFDLELNCKDPDAFIAAVAALEPTFGGVNLEDIKAPECFYIEEQLRKKMSIPVFHDDQHGTSIIAGAAFLNALEVAGKKMDDVRVVFSGGGAAAIACASLFLALGVKPTNLTLCDSKGVVHAGRKDLNQYKARFAHETKLRTIEEALQNADAFVGVSVANVLTPDMIKGMAKNPIIFALANPDPEIHPDAARAARPDAIIATGRSDFPNQVNNVLGFPFIFRGALDVRAKEINETMKLAAVKAIAALAKENVPDSVLRAYRDGESYQFGRDYLIPKPVDPRVLFHVAPAVAQAAIDSGVARKPIDIAKYRQSIEHILGPTQSLMRSLNRDLAARRRETKKKPTIVIPNAYDRRILRAASQVVDEGEVKIILLGSEKRIMENAVKWGVPAIETKVELLNPFWSELTEGFADTYFTMRQRKGITKAVALEHLYNHNYFAAMLLHEGRADGVVSGVVEPYGTAARPLLEVIGVRDEQVPAGVYMVMYGKRQYFFADCTINIDPTAEQLADIAVSTAKVAARYTSEQVRVAMLSFASFGATRTPDTLKVARAVELVRAKEPGLEVDGEMQADVAFSAELRAREFPFCKLTGEPNVIVFPNLASSNIAYKMLANLAGASLVGPILIGMNQPANVLQISATTDEVINMIYLTAHQAVSKFV
jgi:malate dehydrogenase (oxaloacetate-decarboxylating)(NADP+)